MMKLLKLILSGLTASLKALGRFVTWPLQALAGGGGGMSAPPPAIADLDQANDPVADRERAMSIGAAMAEMMLAWSADSMIADTPARLPDGMTDELKSWACGLSRDECETILQSDERAISAHIQGVFLIPGVRRVQPLTPAAWGPARTRDLDFEPSLTGGALLAP